MPKLAICFAGQGSQYVGMGVDYIESNASSKKIASDAKDVLGYDVLDAFKDEKSMAQTLYTQPLIVLKSIFGYELIKSLDVNVDAYLGFSLGEYTAYYAAGVFDLKQVLKIILKRATYMEADALKVDGKMAAIIGSDLETIEGVCNDLSAFGVIQVANFNSPVQYVISGESELVVKACELLKAKGAKRAIVLNTSGAFHTELMKDAAHHLVSNIKADQSLWPKQPLTDLVMNVDGMVLKGDILYHLENQMTHPVKFIDSIKTLKAQGVTHVLEIGPGKVLSGLIRKIDGDLEVINFDSYAQYEDVKGWLKTHGFTK